jgi:glycosyltransferase involved in cell wall biosynthesis
MKSDILASIVIPIHNTASQDRSEMISDLLDTIPDRSDIEIILVDDRSTLPYQIRYAHRKTVVREVQNDRGSQFAGTARNVGCRVALGEYIIYSDSDDLFHRDELNNILGKLKSSKNDVILFKTETFGDGPDRHININSASDRVKDKSEPLEALAWYGSPVGLCIKKDFLSGNDIKFPQMKTSEDRVFAARLAAKRPTTHVLDICAYRIRSHQSLVTDVQPETFRSVVDATRLANASLQAEGMDPFMMSLLRPIMEYARIYPGVAICELVKSIRIGDPLLPRRFRPR